MKNFFNKKVSTKTKLISSAISLMLIVCFAITGTVAWLMDATEEVTDTFTYGKVDIELLDGDDLPNTVTKWNDSTHSGNNSDLYTAPSFKLIPGATIRFNPVVRVVSGSEKCYVFVKITEKNNTTPGAIDAFKDSVGNSVGDNWEKLDGEDGVYYQAVSAVTSNFDLKVFPNGQFTVSKYITNTVIGNLDSITIKAYAIQADHLTDQNSSGAVDAADAWALIKNAETTSSIPNYTSPTN